MSAGVLTAIHVYPVKSCRGVRLDSVEVTGRGLADDRMFQVVDESGAPVTQRQQPLLATVRPTLVGDGLRLEADGRSPLEVPSPTTNDATATSLLGVPVRVGDAGDEAADWFSAVAGSPVRLVAMTEESECPLPLPGLDISLNWSDAAQVLVASTDSLDWLTTRGAEPFGMDRFRPNLTIATGDPWVEDTWRDFSIGAARLGLGFAWPRCAIPQVDQLDGTRHREPAKVLREHRWCTTADTAEEALRPLFEGNALFGIGCSIGASCTSVSVGDEIVVHHAGPRIIPAPTG